MTQGHIIEDDFGLNHKDLPDSNSTNHPQKEAKIQQAQKSGKMTVEGFKQFKSSVRSKNTPNRIPNKKELIKKDNPFKAPLKTNPETGSNLGQSNSNVTL